MTTLIIQVISLLILLLFALPGTQAMWNRGASDAVKNAIHHPATGNYNKKSVVKKLRLEAARLAASIF